MNYWIFKVNPDDYDIDGHLAYHDKRITWRTPDHEKEIKVNDIAFIWRTGTNGGIIAILDIDGKPQMRKIFEHEKQFIKKNISLADVMVTGKLRDVQTNLHQLLLKKMQQTSDLSVFKNSTKAEFSRGTNYRVTKEEGEAILLFIHTLKKLRDITHVRTNLQKH